MSITTRFSEIIGNKIEDYAFHILGCGAIGSSAATQLVRCGAQNMYLYDMDHVSTENIGVSQYSLKDINQPKVFALSEILKGISDNCYIDAINGEFDTYYADADKDNIIILGFDSMSSRLDAVTRITNCPRKPIAIIDGRMGAEHYQQYNIIKPTLKKYLSTWYSDEKGSPDPCNAKATSYCSNMSGSFIANAVRKIVTKQPLDKEISFNFPTNMLWKKA